MMSNLDGTVQVGQMVLPDPRASRGGYVRPSQGDSTLMSSRTSRRTSNEFKGLPPSGYSLEAQGAFAGSVPLSPSQVSQASPPVDEHYRTPPNSRSPPSASDRVVSGLRNIGRRITNS
jgi:hypothetical protein